MSKDSVQPDGKMQQASRKPWTDSEFMKELYEEKGLSLGQIGELIGLHRDVVHYWLRKHGIKTRTKAKRSKLLRYSLGELQESVKTKGIRGLARELEIDESTLRHHLKTRGGKG